MKRRVPVLLALALLLRPGDDALAQKAEDLAAACAAVGGDALMCALAAAGGRDLSGYVALLAAPGADIAGQSSTLGRRLGGMPRIAASLRASGLSVVVSDLSDATGAREASSFVPAAQATLALGLFDGVSVLPTVGGLFSLDVVGSGSFLFFPEADGFDGRVEVFSLGVRVGILRESFTLPAVTVSASRRFAGAMRLGSAGGGDLAQVALDPSVTSFRATVGKDLFAFGVMAGVGWDDWGSETIVRATNGVGGFASASESLEGSRRTYFAGLSKQLGVLSWISAEVGWVRGFTPVTSGAAASPDAGRTVYGSVALLLKL